MKRSPREWATLVAASRPGIVRGEMAGDASHRTGTQAVERALAVLRALEHGPDTLSLTEIADRTHLSQSTAHRLVRALCDAELLHQDLGTERYGLGSRLVSLGARAASALGLSSARPVLEALSAETGESVNLGVRDEDEVVVLLCVPSSHELRFEEQVGSRVPVYASAMGKAILAFTPGSNEALGSLGRLARLTRSTITSRPELRRVLGEVRERGWALNDEERVQGVRTVAAPVRRVDGTARAAIAVQGPAVRMTDEQIARIAPQVKAAAAEITNLLGAGH